MNDSTNFEATYASAAILMPMVRLQGLTLAALVERKVLTAVEARAIIQDASDSIAKLRVSDELKVSVSKLFATLKAEF